MDQMVKFNTFSREYRWRPPGENSSPMQPSIIRPLADLGVDVHLSLRLYGKCRYMNTIEYSIHSASGVLWMRSQLFVSFQVEGKNPKQQSSKNPSVGFHDHWSHAVAYSSLPTESDRTHGTKDSDPFGRRVVLWNHYENRNHKKSTYFAGVAPQSKMSQRSTVCWKIKNQSIIYNLHNYSIMRLKFPSHLNICWEESKLTGKVTWMNSLAAMKVVRFTWKPSQTTWIHWSWSLCPRHPSELHREASAKKHQKSASKPWHKLHPCSAPLGIDMRFLFTPISWHLSKPKLGQKVQPRLHPKLQKTWCFSCSCTFVVFNVFMVAMTPAFWYSATLFSKKLVFPCREIISIQSKGFERWKILGWFSDINKRSATNSMYWAMSTWKWGTNTLKQTWKIKIQTTRVFLKNYLARHQGCHSNCHASVPFRTTRAYGDVWIRVVFHLCAKGLSSFPANCTVKLHLKVEKCWVKSQRCLLGMANHMASVNLQKLSKLFKSIPLMLKRSTTWVPTFSLVIFYPSFTIFALKLGWGTNEFSFGLYSTSDDRMDNIIGKPMLQHAIDETGKLRM